MKCYCHIVQICNRNNYINLEIIITSSIAHLNSFCLISRPIVFIGLSPLRWESITFMSAGPLPLRVMNTLCSRSFVCNFSPLGKQDSRKSSKSLRRALQSNLHPSRADVCYRGHQFWVPQHPEVFWSLKLSFGTYHLSCAPFQPTLWPKTSDVALLSLSFIVCKMRIFISCLS